VAINAAQATKVGQAMKNAIIFVKTYAKRVRPGFAEHVIETLRALAEHEQDRSHEEITDQNDEIAQELWMRMGKTPISSSQICIP